MARDGKLGRLVKLAKDHWVISAWLGIVSFAVGYVAISTFVSTVRDQLAPEPVPEVIQLEKVPDDSLAYDDNRTRWMVTLMNRSAKPMGVTRARYRVDTLSDVAFFANAVELGRNVYRLPLDCKSGTGSIALIPPFEVPPGSFASFVIDGGDKDLDCLFRLSFVTTQGSTSDMLAEPF